MRNVTIHPTAIVSENAVLGDNVFIGPYCIVGPNVELKNEVHLVAHVCLSGQLVIGEKTKVYPFACLGYPPQDLKYKGEASSASIGAGSVIREHVTVQLGTEGGEMHTSVGERCLLMVGSHVAHDCKIGNDVILANNATLGGHVTIDDFAIIGGLSAIHQFVRIGKHAMIGGMSGIDKDVVPYGMATGERAILKGLNLTGLKRHGFSRETLRKLLKFYQEVFETSNEKPLLEKATRFLEVFPNEEAIFMMANFIQQAHKRPLCTPKG